MKLTLFIMTTWICLLAGCSTVSKTNLSFSDWDRDKDQKVGRSEFVETYMKQGYFARWGEGASTIQYNDLFSEAFESIDSDKDGKLSLIEFNSRIKLFYFGLFYESFDDWDNNSDASINKTEFNNHVTKTNLAGLWDTDSNRVITEREMAGGMFYVCDLNSDGSVDETELNAWKRNRQTQASVEPASVQE